MTRNMLIASRGTFAKNLLSNWASLLCDVAVAFFLTPFIVQTLGLALYGVWSLMNSLVGSMGIADFGIRGSTQRFINQALARRDQRELNEVVNTSTSFLVLVSVLLLVIAWILGLFFFDLFPRSPRELKGIIPVVLLLLSLNLAVTFVTSVYTNVIMALERFEIVNGIRISSLAIRAGGVIWALDAGHGFLGLVAASLAASIYSLITTLVVAFRLHPPLRMGRRYLSYRRFSTIWRYGIAVFMVRAAESSIFQADQIIIMIFLGPREVGIYSIVLMLIQYVHQLLHQITVSWVPSVMKAAGVGDLEGLRTVFLSHARLALLLGTLCYGGLAVYGDAFITLWMDSHLPETALLAALLAGAELFGLMASTSRPTLFGLEMVRTNVTFTFSYAALNILLSISLVGVLDLGLLGVALGTLLSSAVMRGLVHPFLAARAIGIEPVHYYLSMGGRLITAALLSGFLFTWVRDRLIPPLEWSGLSASVALAVCLFVTTIPVIFYTPGEMLAAFRSIWHRPT